MSTVEEYRRLFPRGLEQPEGTFRCSVDALLLAHFASVADHWRMADLGTGCGVVACALALRQTDLRGVGLEREDVLAAAARCNVARLGLEDRLHMVHGDADDAKVLAGLGAGAYDLVAANPPYRVEGEGRRSPHPARQRALAAPPDSLEIFCRAARFLLRHHGYFACVFPAERLPRLLAVLFAQRLGPRRLRCVHTRPGKDAELVLVEARKDAAPCLRIESPWLLWEQSALERDPDTH